MKRSEIRPGVKVRYYDNESILFSRRYGIVKRRNKNSCTIRPTDDPCCEVYYTEKVAYRDIVEVNP